MSSIQGGQPQFNPQLIQQQAAAKIQGPQTTPQTQKSASTAKASSAPTQTTLSSQKVQQLTSETTKASIKNLIQTSLPQVPEQMPQLKFLQKPSVSGNLSQLLGGHQAETASQQQAQPQQQAAAQANNPQAAMAAGQLQTSHMMPLKRNSETDDSAWQNTSQSGRKAKKDEQEGEFSSLDDFEGGDFGGGAQQDERSDSQKKKQLLKKSELHKKTLKKPLQKPGLKKDIKPPGHKKKDFF